MTPYEDEGKIPGGPFSGVGPHTLATFTPTTGEGSGRFDLTISVDDDSGAQLADTWQGTYRLHDGTLTIQASRQAPINADLFFSLAAVALDVLNGAIRVRLTSVLGAVARSYCRFNVAGALSD